MKHMQVREAKAHFSEAVDSVVRGEPVTITRHGTPVAMLVPISKGEQLYPQTSKSFGQHLLEYPGGIELEREPSPIRDVDL